MVYADLPGQGDQHPACSWSAPVKQNQAGTGPLDYLIGELAQSAEITCDLHTLLCS